MRVEKDDKNSPWTTRARHILCHFCIWFLCCIRLFFLYHPIFPYIDSFPDFLSVHFLARYLSHHVKNSDFRPSYTHHGIWYSILKYIQDGRTAKAEKGLFQICCLSYRNKRRHEVVIISRVEFHLHPKRPRYIVSNVICAVLSETQAGLSHARASKGKR